MPLPLLTSPSFHVRGYHIEYSSYISRGFTGLKNIVESVLVIVFEIQFEVLQLLLESIHQCSMRNNYFFTPTLEILLKVGMS
jgi:hypothetical protein